MLSLLNKIFLQLLCVFSIVNLIKAWDNGLKEKYDGYGKDWIFIPDGKERPQVAVLKGIDLEERGAFDEKVAFILYTRTNPEKGEELFTNDTIVLKNSPFSHSKPTKFITHGWKSSIASESVVSIMKEYLRYGDYNIVLINWEPLAASTFYAGPVANTIKVAKESAQFIDFVIRVTGLSPDNIHVIGHSLGAHVASYIGEQVTSGKLGRITGLDPARPGFNIHSKNFTSKFNPAVAKFVDVIHTCGKWLSFYEPLGHIDFYPNAGTPIQPGCCCLPEIIDACSHGRAYKYFAESITSKVGLLSLQCDSWDNYKQGHCDNLTSVLLGEHVDKSARGQYFLSTRSEPPYAIANEIFNNEV